MVREMVVRHSQMGKTNGVIMKKVEEVFKKAVISSSLEWVNICLTALVTDSTYPLASVKSDRLTISRLTLLLQILEENK